MFQYMARVQRTIPMRNDWCAELIWAYGLVSNRERLAIKPAGSVESPVLKRSLYLALQNVRVSRGPVLASHMTVIVDSQPDEECRK